MCWKVCSSSMRFIGPIKTTPTTLLVVTAKLVT
jgi:hypothetical protein